MSLLLLSVLSCMRPECARPAYHRAECRVQAENSLARLQTSGGVELRFQAVGAADAESWSATGLLQNQAGGPVRARVATLGDFRLSVQTDTAQTLSLILDNVDPRIPALEGEVGASGLTRTLELDLEPGVQWIDGQLPEAVCDGSFRLAAAGDIQTNPIQFRRIIDALHSEVTSAESAGAPLVGLVLLGDISEFSNPDELEQVLDILASSPVPVAVIPGNHDVFASGDAVFNRLVGPGNLAFDVCSARLALFDTGSGSLAPSIEGRLPEFFTTEQPHLIAGMHHPPMPGNTSGGWSDELSAATLLAEFSARGGELLLAAHVHERLEMLDGPVPQVIVGTLGADQVEVDPDYGYLRVSVEDQVSWCFVPVPAPGSAGSSRPPPQDCVSAAR